MFSHHAIFHFPQHISMQNIPGARDPTAGLYDQGLALLFQTPVSEQTANQARMLFRAALDACPPLAHRQRRDIYKGLATAIISIEVAKRDNTNSDVAFGLAIMYLELACHGLASTTPEWNHAQTLISGARNVQTCVAARKSPSSQ